MLIRFLSAFLLSIVVLLGTSAGIASESGAQDANASADAHGDDAHAINWTDFSNEEIPSLVAMFVNFALLVFVLFLLMRKPVGKAVLSRKEEIEGAIKEANTMRDAAQKALLAAQEKIKEIDAVTDGLKEDMQRRTQAEVDRILKDATLNSEKLKRDTAALVEQETAQMAQRIRDDVAADVIIAAEQLLVTQIKPVDQDKLAKEYLSTVEDTVSS